MALPERAAMCQISLDSTMWARWEGALLGYIHTRHSDIAFLLCDWACGCLVSATAAPIMRQLRVRKQSEQQDAMKAQRPGGPGCALLPRAHTPEDADESILPLLGEERSHSQGQDEEGSKM